MNIGEILPFVVAIGSWIGLMILMEWLKRFRWTCKLGWHDGYGLTNGFDGCSFTGVCSKCGKKVLMDSQGNWF